MIILFTAVVVSFLIKFAPMFFSSRTSLNENSMIIRTSTTANYLILGVLISNGLFSAEIGKAFGLSETKVLLQGLLILMTTVIVSLATKSIYISVSVSALSAGAIFALFNGIGFSGI